MASHVEMQTLTAVLEKLRLKKRDNEFRFDEKGLTSGCDKYYQPGDLKIVKTFRFEGDSNPDDNTILYLIEANDGSFGYSLDAYGAYSNHVGDGYDSFIRQIPVEDRDDQLLWQ